MGLGRSAKATASTANTQQWATLSLSLRVRHGLDGSDHVLRVIALSKRTFLIIGSPEQGDAAFYDAVSREVSLG